MQTQANIMLLECRQLYDDSGITICWFRLQQSANICRISDKYAFYIFLIQELLYAVIKTT